MPATKQPRLTNPRRPINPTTATAPSPDAPQGADVALAPSLPAQSTPPPDPTTVVHSLPCIKCWYDLRTLDLTARCPECGTPVSKTKRSLFASDPDYLTSLRRKLVGLEALWTVNFLIVITLPFSMSRELHPLVFGDVRIPFAFLLAVVFMVRGAALFCQVITPEGRLPRTERVPYRWVAVAFNWACGIAAAFTTGAAALAVAHARANLNSVVLGGVCATALLLLLRNIALAPHLRRMSRRLSIHVRWGTPWLLPALGAASYGVGVCSLLLLGQYFASTDTLMAIGMIMFFIGSCSALGVVSKVRRRIRDVLRFRESHGKVRPRHAR